MAVVPVSQPRRMRYQDDMEAMFDTLTDLSTQQRDAIKARYRFLMSEYRYRCRVYSFLFYVLRITMSVGSIAVPALMSLTVAPESESLLKWFTWSVSVSVTIAHGLTTLFKLDRRFFMLHAVAERLRTETWQYLELTGRYSGHWGGQRPSHRNQYALYTSQIEKIRMKHIDEEFVRGADMGSDPRRITTQQNTANDDAHSTPANSAVVPSPADQAIMQTPPPRAPFMRRQSSSTLGSEHEDETSIAMPVPGQRRTPVPTAGATGEPLLLEASALSSQSSLTLRAPLQSRQVQSESTGPGNT